MILVTLDYFIFLLLFLFLTTPWLLCLCGFRTAEQSRASRAKREHSSGHQVKFTPRSDSCVSGETRDVAAGGVEEVGEVGGTHPVRSRCLINSMEI